MAAEFDGGIERCDQGSQARDFRVFRPLSLLPNLLRALLVAGRPLLLLRLLQVLLLLLQGGLKLLNGQAGRKGVVLEHRGQQMHRGLPD